MLTAFKINLREQCFFTDINEQKFEVQYKRGGKKG